MFLSSWQNCSLYNLTGESAEFCDVNCDSEFRKMRKLESNIKYYTRIICKNNSHPL
jgi:hypothetical protein